MNVGDYAQRLYGNASGYVAVAYKRKDESWDERAFEWPHDRAKLERWVDEHAGANLFICPALRREDRRRKGDGVNLRWLWADVDWAKVPDREISRVQQRIQQLATIIVRSGSVEKGEPNVHVYVALTREVTVDEHIRLNTGLREYLFADFKQADNSLLRVPGSRNWKTAHAVEVKAVGGNRKRQDPAKLAALPTFAKAAVNRKSTEGVTWTPVDTTTVPARLLRRTQMLSDEAIGRYGSRHAAVWAVTGDLFRAGLDEDTIHTLMDDFPPALDKAADEHGAYDVHSDLERRLSVLRPAQAAVDAGEDGDEGAFTELSDEDLRAWQDDSPMVRRILERREANRRADIVEAQRRFIAPPVDVSWSAADALANPPAPMPYLIDGMAGAKHNVLLTAQYKVGKTSFVIGTVARSLVDGEPFLGEREVPHDGRVVGHWNCEMEARELLDDYVRPAGFNHPDRLHVANLRGYAINVLSPVGKAWTVDWLRSRGVQVWCIDSLARLLRMAGVKEQENDAVLNVLMAVDEIKVEAGVDVSFLIAHTGRMQHEEGSERARGATVIDDWPDARWVMTRDGVTRFLSVDGRGVTMDTTSLDWNAETKRSVLGVGGRADVRAAGEVQTVVAICNDTPGITKESLLKKMVERGVKGRADRLREVVEEAVETGWIEVRKETGTRGRAKQTHWPVTAGKVEGGASRFAVNMGRGRR